MLKDSLDIVHRLSRAIAKAQSLEAVYELILSEIVQAMDVERASIMRFDAKNQVLRIVAAKGIDPDIWKHVEITVGEGVSGKVWQEGQPLLIKNFKPNPRYKGHSFLIAPVTAFPMQVKGVPIGLINLTDKKSGRPFTQTDLKLLMTLSDQVASYLHLYDLLERLHSAEQAKMELEVARDIQQRLLPKADPKIKGVALEGCLIPAARVGADFYDFFEQNGLHLCIADISGHGVGGALLAFAARSCLRGQANGSKSPAQTLEKVNQILFPDLMRSEQFVSLFYGRYLPDEQVLIYSNAGHNPPLLWSVQEGEPHWLFTQDSLLGIEPDAPYKDKKCRFASGDTLILYTDGLTEAIGTDGQRFGSNRLVQTIAECSQQSAGGVLAHVLNRWRSFTGHHTVQDDVTVAVLKVL